MDWLRRVERLCDQRLDDRVLRDRLLDLVRERVPYDGHVFALTDPATRVEITEASLGVLDAAGTGLARIYNRVVFDELESKKIELPFRYGEELDVTWCSHPNWYWTWSKYTLPYIRHVGVPRAWYVNVAVPLKLVPGV